MKVSVAVMSGSRYYGTVDIREGHLDKGYIEATVEVAGDSRTSITLSRDEAEAVAANITLALKHDASRARGR